MEVRGRRYGGLSNLRIVALISSIIISVLFFPFPAFADAETVASRAVASRSVNGEVFYYSTLHEAFTAAGGISLDAPDEITLLADVVLDEPIVIESGKHIRLVVTGGERTITRGANIDYPLFWIRANEASFTLGASAAEGETSGNSLTIDGGYYNEPSIEARAPLIAINGQRAHIIMETGVTLQNNYNYGDADGTSLHANGGAVYIRTDEGGPENQGTFVMRGGVIRGNINNTQNPYSCGGAVFISAFGLFAMEGGEILDNTSYRSGGGFHTGSRGSFKKTGGVIYGQDAPEGLRNTVIDGTGVPLIYGHAVTVALTDKPMFHFRDDTVGKNDVLSYSGSIKGNGVFGEGEKWERPHAVVPRYLIIAVFALVLLAGVLVFFIARTRRKRLAARPESGAPDPDLEKIIQNLTPGEKEVFDLLLTERSLKEIAGDLNISYSGANFHTQNIYEKAGVKSRTEFLIKFK